MEYMYIHNYELNCDEATPPSQYGIEFVPIGLSLPLFPSQTISKSLLNSISLPHLMVEKKRLNINADKMV